MKYLSPWKESKLSKHYHYSEEGNSSLKVARKIANLYQKLASSTQLSEKELIVLVYGNYECYLDISWEETFYDTLNLEIILYVIKGEEIVNKIYDLKISDIYKEQYLERKMFYSIFDEMSENEKELGREYQYTKFLYQ